MGTNYYAQAKPPCSCCKREYEDIHIGKSSSGWKFGFRAYAGYQLPDAPNGIRSFKSWMEYLDDKRIVNEYREEVDLDYLTELIESKKDGLSQYRDSIKEDYGGHFIDKEGYEFCDREFS